MSQDSLGLLIFSSMKQVQPKLLTFYTGPDPMFSRNACANCKFISVGAKDCTGCKKIVCESCFSADPSGSCTNCRTPFATLEKLHPVVQEMYERATFKCLFDCGQTHINYKDYEQHVLGECHKRYISCPNRCGSAPFRANELDEHRRECSHESIECNACRQAHLPRCDLKRHQDTECPRGQQECDKCHGIFKASEGHCCISQLYKMIQADRAAAAADRSEINEGFGQQSQMFQHSLLALD